MLQSRGVHQLLVFSTPCNRTSLFLCRGYNTEAERAAALELQGVRSITLAPFNELIKFGILMGVDDGCQDD